MKKNYLMSLILSSLLSLFISGMAVGPVSLAAQEGVTRISIDELKKMMDRGEEVTIIDAQPEAVYNKGHIRGAVSIPWKSQLTLEDVWDIQGGVPIVIYCACGAGESDSSDMARQFIKMGYSDVKVLEHPAIEGWKKAGYPVDKK